MLSSQTSIATKKLEALNRALAGKLDAAAPVAFSGRLLAFDIDGFLTLPGEAEVSSELVQGLCSLVDQRGDLLLLVTGRPLSWAIETVGSKIVAGLQTRGSCGRFAIGAEKGAVSCIVKDGAYAVDINPDSKVSEEICRAFRAMNLKTVCTHSDLSESERSVLSDVLRYDEEKLAMATVYVPDQPSETLPLRCQVFSKIRPLVERYALELLKTYDPAQTLMIDPTVIAVDIESRRGGKAVAISSMIKLLGLCPADQYSNSSISSACFPIKQVFTGGDSPSDLQMSAEFVARGFSVAAHFHTGARLNSFQAAPAFACREFPDEYGRAGLEIVKKLNCSN